MGKVKVYRAVVEEIRDEVREDGQVLVKSFGMRIDDAEFTFRVGEFLMVSIPGILSDSGRPVQRAYSLSTSPYDPLVEIAVKLVPDGRLSPALFELSPGAELHGKGPFGHAYLEELGDGRKLFGAGGIGVAPIRGIIRHMVRDGRLAREPVTLYYGARTPCQFTFLDEFMEYEGLPGFRMIRGVDAPHSDWSGPVGYVHQIVEQVPPDRTDSTAFLCGPPVMVRATRQTLLDLGMAESRIFKEEWD